MEPIGLEQNDDRLVNITFTDVMKVVASDNTTPEDKMVYIYLLNVIMDMDEKIERMNNTLNELQNTQDEYED
jgi:hypothetical protein